MGNGLAAQNGFATQSSPYSQPFTHRRCRNFPAKQFSDPAVSTRTSALGKIKSILTRHLHNHGNYSTQMMKILKTELCKEIGASFWVEFHGMVTYFVYFPVLLLPTYIYKGHIQYKEWSCRPVFSCLLWGITGERLCVGERESRQDWYKYCDPVSKPYMEVVFHLHILNLKRLNNLINLNWIFFS